MPKLHEDCLSSRIKYLFIIVLSTLTTHSHTRAQKPITCKQIAALSKFTHIHTFKSLSICVCVCVVLETLVAEIC